MQVGSNGHHAAAHHVGWEDATSRDDSATRNNNVLSAVKVEPSGLGPIRQLVCQVGGGCSGAGQDRTGQAEAHVVYFCFLFPVMEIGWMWIGRADPSRSTQPESPGLGCLADVLILYSVHASSCRA
jgi:hypothetical protein